MLSAMLKSAEYQKRRCLQEYVFEYTGQHLERRSHPEGVACVYRFVGAPVEAGLLPHDTPAADPVQLSPTQRLLQATHQTQRGYGAVRPATCT